MKPFLLATAAYLAVLTGSLACGGGSGGGADGGSGGSGPSAGSGGVSQGGSAGLSAGAGVGGVSGGTAGTSGAAGASGAGSGGAAGASGASGSGGGGGNTSGLKGGASGKFVCAPGATYGDPLAGMGMVSEFKAPSTGPFTFFAFLEGPIWVPGQNAVFFSDIPPPERIWKLAPPATTPELVLQMSGSNGLALDSDDQLLIADQAGKRIVRRNPAMLSAPETVVVPMGSFTPNDLIFRSDGNLYFTDPSSGFYRVAPGGGAPTGPNTSVSGSNGSALSPD